MVKFGRHLHFFADFEQPVTPGNTAYLVPYDDMRKTISDGPGAFAAAWREMQFFTNFSLGVAADERCTFFRRHGVNFEFNDRAEDDNDDDNDDAINNEW